MSEDPSIPVPETLEYTSSIDLRDAYLELLKRSLSHTLYTGADAMGFSSRRRSVRLLVRGLARRGIVQLRVLPDGERQRAEGRVLPLFAQTMVGLGRLENVRHAIETVLDEDVPGDLIETGVWRGGASIFMRGVLAAHGNLDRTVWLADSFQGLPPPRPDRYPEDAGAEWHSATELAVGVEEVRENFRRYGLLDDRVRFLPGWFRDTLPAMREHQWALVRLDGDMYESTWDALTNLYGGLAPGGFLIVDDYSIDSCRQAVEDFRRAEEIDAPLSEIDWTGVFWRK